MKKKNENKTEKRRRVPVPQKPPKVIKSGEMYDRKRTKRELQKAIRETKRS